jgi:hypothetical protein
MRTIENIIIHCADTPTGKPLTVADIDSWHVERGFHRAEQNRTRFNPGLKAIGYHFVIYLDGSVHTGRAVEEIGAHVQGMNATSIGICMIGSGKYNREQWSALNMLTTKLLGAYPKAHVIGHCQTPSGAAQGKLCPEFDVTSWLKNSMVPETAHVIV